MTLKRHFALNSVCAGVFGAVKPGFRSLATLKLVMNVVGKLYTEKNSCGIARFPCDSTVFLLAFTSVTSTLEVFLKRYALYKSTFYFLTYLLGRNPQFATMLPVTELLWPLLKFDILISSFLCGSQDRC